MIGGFSVAYVTPYFETQGLPEYLTSIPWLAQPLGLFLAGIPISIVSDRCFCLPIGRRRPWLLFSVVVASLGLAIFPNSHIVGGGVGTLATRVVALCSYLVLSAGSNGIDASAKGLLADAVPAKKQLETVNLVLSVFGGLGTLTGFAVGAIPFIEFVPYASVNIQPVCFVAGVILLLCVGTTALCVREKRERGIQTSADAEEESHSLLELREDLEVSENPVSDRSVSAEEECDRAGPKKENACVERVFRPLCRLPCSFYITWAIQFFCHAAKSIAYIYMSDFVGSSVFLGDATAPVGTTERNLYEAGVRWCSLGLVAGSVIGIAYAFLLHPLVRIIPVKLLWFAGNLLLGVLFISGGLFPNKYYIIVVLCFYGICQTTMVSLPWGLANILIRKNTHLEKSRSFIQTVFNASQMVPQVVVSLLGGFVLDLFTAVFHWPMESIFVLGGVFGVISAILVIFVRFPKDQEEAEEEKDI